MGAVITQGQHRLDREGHPHLQDGVGGRLVVVRYDQSGVESRVHAVTGVVAHDAVAEAFGIGLDHPADDVHLPARTHGPDPAVHGLLGALGEQPGLLGHVAAEVGGAVVAVHPAEEGGDVDLDQVTVLERTGVGDAVADHLVHRGAARLGEAAVLQRRGVGAVVADVVVHHLVDAVGRHAGGDLRCPGRHRPGGDPSGEAHLLDRLARLHMRAGVAIRAGVSDVVGPLDLGGHRTQGRDRVGLDRGHSPDHSGRLRRVRRRGVTRLKHGGRQTGRHG